MSAYFEPILGRYLHLDLFGRKHRLYVEQAGEGTPLLCLHTAGADGRQYRALMNDERVTSRHRVIAFDMPWHGKSSPPSGWHNEEYQLTSAQYTSMILDIMAALGLDKPILIGCSIGGRIALHLALEHPDRFRAIIGLQAGAHVDPYYDLNFLHRADVHGGEISGAIVSGLVGPDAPEAERWETLWHYMQGGPGVFKGDLYFYKIDGDIRDRVADIDTRRCPLFLLSGEYDYSCTPEEMLAVASSVAGCEATIMKGLGAFSDEREPGRVPEISVAGAGEDRTWCRKDRIVEPARSGRTASMTSTLGFLGARRTGLCDFRIVLIADFRDRKPPAAFHRHDAEREAGNQRDCRHRGDRQLQHLPDHHDGCGHQCRDGIKF